MQPQKHKAKVLKDLHTTKFMVSMPLLLQKVVFDGALLVHIPSLKLADWDLVEHEKFPQLAPNKNLVNIYYEETEVTWLEPMKWVMGVEKVGLLKMLWVSHFNRTNINIAYVWQFLTLVDYGCL